MERGSLTQYYMDTNIFESLKNQLNPYSNILVIYGKKGLQSVEKDLKNSLEGKHTNYIHFGEECCFSRIDEIMDNLNILSTQCEKYDLIIGVGGGKAIDLSKVVADKMSIPIFTIPTTASTCASTSSLSVIYGENHQYDSLYFLKNAPNCVFINLETLVKAPNKYLWAGIGDTIAKYYEMIFKMTGETSFNYSTNLAKNICLMCKESILSRGEEALKSSEVTDAFKDVVGTIIISTGYVSNLIDFKYNGALAHGIFNALTLIDRVEEEHLHGEVVAFGVLVQLIVENKDQDYKELSDFYKKINLPTTLTDIVILEEYFEKKESILDTIFSDTMASAVPLTISREFLAMALEKK